MGSAQAHACSGPIMASHTEPATKKPGHVSATYTEPRCRNSAVWWRWLAFVVAQKQYKYKCKDRISHPLACLNPKLKNPN